MLIIILFMLVIVIIILIVQCTIKCCNVKLQVVYDNIYTHIMLYYYKVVNRYCIVKYIVESDTHVHE